MTSFQLKVNQLKKWLSDEGHQKIILHEPLNNGLYAILQDIDFEAALIMFNVKVDTLGFNKVLELLTDNFPSYCLLSTRMPKALTVNGLHSTLFMLDSKLLKDFSKNRLRELNVGILLAPPSHFLFDTLNVEKMTIDICDAQDYLANCVNQVKELTVKEFKTNDRNLQHFIIEEKTKLNTLSLPESVEFVYTKVFGHTTTPLKIYFKNSFEISFQKGAFNHEVNHTIFIPNGAKVKCHSEDREYLKSHIQRY